MRGAECILLTMRVFTTQNRVTTLAPQGKESDKRTGRAHSVRYGGPAGGVGTEVVGSGLRIHLGGLSSQGTERWHQVWLGLPAARRPPHLSTVPEGGARAAFGPWGVTFPGFWARGRGTGCVRHLSSLTRPPRGRQPGGWEAKQRLVPTASPDKATEESGQQVVGRAVA